MTSIPPAEQAIEQFDALHITGRPVNRSSPTVTSPQVHTPVVVGGQLFTKSGQQKQIAPNDRTTSPSMVLRSLQDYEFESIAAEVEDDDILVGMY